MNVKSRQKNISSYFHHRLSIDILQPARQSGHTEKNKHTVVVVEYTRNHSMTIFHARTLQEHHTIWSICERFNNTNLPWSSNTGVIGEINLTSWQNKLNNFKVLQTRFVDSHDTASNFHFTRNGYNGQSNATVEIEVHSTSCRSTMIVQS